MGVSDFQVLKPISLTQLHGRNISFWNRFASFFLIVQSAVQ